MVSPRHVHISFHGLVAAEEKCTQIRMLLDVIKFKIQKPSAVDKDRVDHGKLAEVVTECRVKRK